MMNQTRIKWIAERVRFEWRYIFKARCIRDVSLLTEESVSDRTVRDMLCESEIITKVNAK